MRPVYYIIGDIHGEFERLLLLHANIRIYHQKHFPMRLSRIVHLGDYVDRGPDSFSVVEHVMQLVHKVDGKTEVINLKGNHEAMMLDAHADPLSPQYQQWIRNGGQETLESYALNGFSKPPQSHIKWMSSLPSYYQDTDSKMICVHAGINIRTFPHDGEDFHLWTRSPEFFNVESWDNPELKGMIVIHGHTPTDTFEPEISKSGNRVNIDTGACYGGALTAAVIDKGQILDFLSA